MRRREFLSVLGGFAASWPLAAHAQQPVPVIGYLSARAAQTDAPMVAAFREGLRNRGFVEGQNVAIDYRWGEGQYDRLAELVGDLVRRQVAVIVTSGGEISALAAKAATASIPIVFTVGNDPVRFGLVASLSRPGGNLTGVTSFHGTLGAKQLGLLRELVPAGSLIAMLVNPNEPTSEPQREQVQVAAAQLGQELLILSAGADRDIDRAYATLVQRKAAALLVSAGPFFVTRQKQLIELAARHAIPVMYFRRELPEAGGLMSYGSSTIEGYRQMGDYTGRVLKGEKPSELPVVQPTNFQLVINLKTARTLGLTIPPAVLAIADEVIE